MAIPIMHVPIRSAGDHAMRVPGTCDGRERLSPWCRNDDAGGGPWWMPVARAVTLVSPNTRSAGETDIDGRVAEAMAYAADASRYRRFPRAPARPPTSDVDVVGIGFGGDPVFLLTLVHDDPQAAAFAALRVLHQSLVWASAYERDRTGLVDALNALTDEASGKETICRRVPRFGGFGLCPIIAFDAPPELATVRRTFTLLRELVPRDPRGILLPAEVWAWPQGGEPFRIPERAGSARASKRRCRQCASPYVVGIVHGLPTAEAEASARRGELLLAGCCVLEDDPDWACRACGAEWSDRAATPR